MKTLWFLALAAAPLAILTARGALDFRAGGASLSTDAVEAPMAAAVVQKQAAAAAGHREAAVAMADFDPASPESPRGLQNLRPDSPLVPVRRSLAAWTAAASLVEAFLSAAAADAPRDAGHLRSWEAQWEGFQQRLAAARLGGSDSMAAVAAQRLKHLRQQIARCNAESEALAAAAAAKSAFAAGNYQACWTQARTWLDIHAPSASAPLVEEIKALALRAEFHAQRERSRARLKAAASAADQEALLAAFVERFGSAALPEDSERAVVEQCRQFLDKLRGEAAAAERRRVAEEALRAGLAHLPTDWEDRLALAAGILEGHPLAAVRAALRGRVRQWLEEALPQKHVDEPPGLCEAETRDGRVLRGYFREVLTPDGLVGYKRYDTAAQRDHPTADVGTWLAEDLASPPGASAPQRLVQAYHDARRQLLDSPARKAAWDAFAAACERLQAACDAYRAKPGAAPRVPSFRSEAQLARRTASGPALGALEAIWETTGRPPHD